MTSAILEPALLLIVPDRMLVPFISVASLLCLGLAVVKVQTRRNADQKKIASALAQAIRDRVV